MIEAIEWHYNKKESELDSYTLGLPYFGKHSLGPDLDDLSTTYKRRIKERLHEKHGRNIKELKEFREIISLDKDFDIYRLPNKEKIQNMYYRK